MTIDAPFDPLIADIVTASFSATAEVTNRLIDSLTRQLADANARADAVESTILSLLAGPYMPTPDVLRGALYPSPEVVDRFREEPRWQSHTLPLRRTCCPVAAYPPSATRIASPAPTT